MCLHSRARRVVCEREHGRRVSEQWVEDIVFTHQRYFDLVTLTERVMGAFEFTAMVNFLKHCGTVIL